ncbi:MAG: hypothetical protein M0026_08720 [Nocardiopsaceae bacterium]|nr:hypothetical protein [Nocardiopsaceae bacterium]
MFILSLATCVAALVVIVVAVVLAETTLVYIALGLGGIAALMLVLEVVGYRPYLSGQGREGTERRGASPVAASRTDGLGKASVPPAAAAGPMPATGATKDRMPASVDESTRATAFGESEPWKVPRSAEEPETHESGGGASAETAEMAEPPPTVGHPKDAEPAEPAEEEPQAAEPEPPEPEPLPEVFAESAVEPPPAGEVSAAGGRAGQGDRGASEPGTGADPDRDSSHGRDPDQLSGTGVAMSDPKAEGVGDEEAGPQPPGGADAFDGDSFGSFVQRLQEDGTPKTRAPQSGSGTDDAVVDAFATADGAAEPEEPAEPGSSGGEDGIGAADDAWPAADEPVGAPEAEAADTDFAPVESSGTSGAIDGTDDAEEDEEAGAAGVSAEAAGPAEDAEDTAGGKAGHEAGGAPDTEGTEAGETTGAAPSAAPEPAEDPDSAVERRPDTD